MSEIKCTYLGQEINLDDHPEVKKAIAFINESIGDFAIDYKVSHRNGVYFYKNGSQDCVGSITFFDSRVMEMSINYYENTDRALNDKLKPLNATVDAVVNAHKFRNNLMSIEDKYAPNRNLYERINSTLKIMEAKKALLLKIDAIGRSNVFIQCLDDAIVLHDENHKVQMRPNKVGEKMNPDDWCISFMTQKGKITHGQLDNVNNLIERICALSNEWGSAATISYIKDLITG